jgi:hypothetical protein
MRSQALWEIPPKGWNVGMVNFTGSFEGNGILSDKLS